MYSEQVLGFYTPPSDEMSIPSVFAKWFKTLNCKVYTKKGYSDSIRIFLEFCEASKLYWWKSLRLEHIQEFHQSINHYAYNTVRNRFLPIKSCSKWASINWPGQCHDFARGFTPPQPQQTVFADNIRESLTFEEVAVLLDEYWDDRRFVQGVALQALAGLRIMEVMRLTWDNINGDIITIQGEVKNQSSMRRIPIPRVAAMLLDESRGAGKVIKDYKDWFGYSKIIRASLDQHDIDIPPKNLRKTIPTEFKLRGWEGFVMERYLGHSVKTITDKHYFSVSQAELEELFRQQVVSRIDEILSELSQKRQAKGTLDNVVTIR